MKKIIFCAAVLGLISFSCTDQDNQTDVYDNQIESVDLSTVKRPGTRNGGN